ncbi:MAG TPA: hypothetical protein VFA11_04575 [Acidimicrobiales bacterium]|nr:hypothetical protein [Acidimicrobiales bacterium]
MAGGVKMSLVADHLVPDADPADAAEQHDPAEGELEEQMSGHAGTTGEPAPERDVIEQSMPVGDDTGRVTPRPRPMDVDEADWRDQSIVEPIDDDDVR